MFPGQWDPESIWHLLKVDPYSTVLLSSCIGFPDTGLPMPGLWRFNVRATTKTTIYTAHRVCTASDVGFGIREI